MNPRLTIMICTMTKRKASFDMLLAFLNSQIKDFNLTGEIEIDSECDEGQMSIGAKRNILLDRAKGDYVCFIDDDDWTDAEYCLKIITALKTSPDCVQMIGAMNTDGRNIQRFEHSIAHYDYYDHQGVYYRPPNHLNPIRRDVAQRFRFPESNFGEDTDWAMQVRDSALLQVEEGIDRVIYHYRYNSRK